MRVSRVLLKLLLLGITVSLSQVQAQPVFTKITTGPLVTDRNYSFFPSWGDYDQDGDPDVFVGTRFNSNMGTGPNAFYRNNGDGTFTKPTAEEAGDLAGDEWPSSMGLWLDYDRDGDLDFLLNGGYGPRLYRNDAGGRFVVAEAAGFTDAPGTLALAAGDYDHDGWTDLFLGHGSRSAGGVTMATLLHHDGSAAFSDTGIAWRLGQEQAAAWCDYDTDGDLDLSVGSFSPPQVNGYAFICVYTNSGGGLFDPVFTVERNTAGCPAWADPDNDGDMDLLVGGNPIVFLRNDTLPDGSHRLDRITIGPLSGSSWGDGICPAWGDYDNDGWLDVFITRGFGTGNPGRLFHNHGDGTFSQVTNETPATERMQSFGCAWVDYNNDGFLDLSICNANNESNRLFRNNTNANHWLMLQLKGTTSNTDAIGARVRLQARIGGKSFWQMREIAGLWGDRRAHFGLGDATVAELVRIEWPSGTVQELRDVPADRILNVTEPVRLQTTGPGRFWFRGWLGQIFAVEASADLAAWSVAGTVTNLTGTVEFTDAGATVASLRFYRVSQRD